MREYRMIDVDPAHPRAAPDLDPLPKKFHDRAPQRVKDAHGGVACFLYPSQRTMFYFMGNQDRGSTSPACAPTTTG